MGLILASRACDVRASSDRCMTGFSGRIVVLYVLLVLIAVSILVSEFHSELMRPQSFVVSNCGHDFLMVVAFI